jgi:hypothetical protein
MVLRHVLLLVQGALAALVAVEAVLLGLGLGSPVLTAIGLLAGALAALPIVLAFRLLRGRPRARGFAVAYEALLLVSGFGNAIVLGNDDLASQLVTVVLPLALLWMLLVQLGSVGDPRRHA